MEIPVRCNGVSCGTMDEYDVRDVVRKREGHIVRPHCGQKHFQSFLALNGTATPRTRALCNTSTRSAMSPTQREELYSGFRKIHTDLPVTGVLTVVRKIRGRGLILDKKGVMRCDGELMAWNENERFPRRRWNPDSIPLPLYKSEAHYLARKRKA